MAEIKKIPYDNKIDRVETGPIQFGEDWPGYFIRGDNAFDITMAIQSILVNPYDVLAMTQLKSFAKDLLGCNTHVTLVNMIEAGPVVESADTPTLKAGDESREGSSPSRPTNYGRWAGAMPSSELPAAVGDRRLIAIDGFGQMEAEIISMNDDYAKLKITSEYHTGSVFELDWDLGPNTFIAMKTNGEEYKKYMSDIEPQAMAVYNGN